MFSVISETGSAVDWWFMYKLPHGQIVPGTHKKTKSELAGLNYLYYQPGSANGLSLSQYKLGQQQGALYNSLNHIFSAAEKAHNSVGWFLYNDEIPNTKKNDEKRGHCKGVLAFDKKNDQAVWLLHSTPRFPLESDAVFPEDEQIYGQTFIAITLEGYEAAAAIAGQLRAQQDPQLYAYKLPAIGEIGDDEEISLLCKGVPAPEGPLTSHISFKSKAGKSFEAIAKNRKWGKDFWTDLVGPTLDVDLAVETWRRGKIPGATDSDTSLDVEDVGGVDLSSLGIKSGWHYTKDHAKWAVEVDSLSSEKPEWVCVADINRQVSQEKRGGGTICFRDEALCKALASIEVFSK